MSLKGKDVLFIAGSFLVFILVSVVARILLPDGAVVVSLALALLILLIAGIECYRRVLDALQDHSADPTVNYRQVESLFSLFASLRIGHPLPAMRAAAISPDCAITLISLVRQHRPELIVETGAGVSTVIAGHCLRELGAGRIVSLEQHASYAEISRRNLEAHGLSGIATVVHAPLRAVTIGDRPWEWYAREGFDGLANIDMLIVDGPVQQGQVARLVRYPALPLLFERLSPDAVVLLDDAYREDEKRVVELWLREFACFEVEWVPSEKGTAILRRKKS